MLLPQPSGDFEWVQAAWGRALQCRPLAAVAPHCFTTRDLPLASSPDAAVESPDGGGWRDLARAVGAAESAIVRLRQVHGADVFERAPGRAPGREERDWPAADIAIGNDPAVVLTVRSADCVPLLLADGRTGAVAAVHAGWKGIAEAAPVRAVEALCQRYGANAADLIAAVGPSAGPCCYEVGADLSLRFAAHPEAAAWFSSDEPIRLDLWRATRDQLMRAGVPAGQIHLSGLCTIHHPDVFHSYRRDGASAGRLAAAIRSGLGTTL